MLGQFNETSSQVTQIDGQLDAIRDAAANHIRMLRERNNKTLRLVDEQIAGLHSSLKLIPGAEMELF